MSDPVRLIHTPLGEPGSGRVRYGAAMALFQRGLINEASLEVYRICSPLDAQDPAALLIERNLDPLPWPGVEAAGKLGSLLSASRRYIKGLSGPGSADTLSGLARAVAISPPSPGRANEVVATHLDPALKTLGGAQPELANAIAAANSALNWISYDGYPEHEIGGEFARGHAYASLIGEGAAYWSGDFDFGLFLVAPNVLYRDHAHAAPELYAPLTGPHGWRFAPDAALTIKPAHDPVWNEPNQPHLTKVGRVPFLCLYAWTKNAQSPARIVPASDWAELEALRL